MDIPSFPTSFNEATDLTGNPVKKQVTSLDCSLVEISGIVHIVYMRLFWSIIIIMIYFLIIVGAYFLIVIVKKQKSNWRII